MINTKPKNEERAAVNLQNGGFEVLSPRIKLRKFRDGKPAYIVEPMFPGYIFSRFHPVEDFHNIKYTRGVKSIVRFGEKMLPIDGRVIKYINNRLQNGIAEIKQKPIMGGEPVSIIKGPFAGLKGIFEKELDGKERVAILLEGIHFYARVEIDKESVVSTDFQ